eukprot:403346267
MILLIQDQSEINHVKLQEENTYEDGVFTFTDYTFMLLNSYLSGLKAFDYLPNLSNCSKQLQVTINDYDKTLAYIESQNFSAYTLINASLSPSSQNQPLQPFYLVTRLISNQTAKSVLTCYLTGNDLIQLGMKKIGDFRNMTDFMLAVLKTQMGNIILYNNIYRNLIVYNQNRKQKELYYELGKLTFHIIDIEPFEDSSFISLASRGIDQEFKLKQQQQKVDSVILLKLLTFMSSFLQASLTTANNSTYNPNDSSQITPVTCSKNITKLDSLMRSLAFQVQSEDYLKVGYTIHDILAQIHPLMFSCATGVQQSYQNILQYYISITNPAILFANLYYRLGKIYYIMVEIYDTFTNYTQDTEVYWSILGQYSGTIIDFLFSYDAQEQRIQFKYDTTKVKGSKKYKSQL